MGIKGNLTPDGSNRVKEHLANLSELGIMVNQSSSDSEEDDNSFGVYSALPQDIPDSNTLQEENDSQESSEEENINNEIGNKTEECSFDQATKIEVSKLWNSTTIVKTDIDMDSTKVELIKNAMAGFSLPSSAIPPWAKNMSEEEWENQIISKVKTIKSTI